MQLRAKLIASGPWRITAINTIRRMPSRRISPDLRDALVPMLEDYERLAGVPEGALPGLRDRLLALQGQVAGALATLPPAAPTGAPRRSPSGTRLSAFASARERRPDGTFAPVSERPGPHVDHTGRT